MSETSEKKPAKPVVLTCAQPTGRLHLGNYLGAVLNWGRMQDNNECYFGIVDQPPELTVRNGRMPIPDRPGFGVDLVEAPLRLAQRTGRQATAITQAAHRINQHQFFHLVRKGKGVVPRNLPT